MKNKEIDKPMGANKVSLNFNMWEERIIDVN